LKITTHSPTRKCAIMCWCSTICTTMVKGAFTNYRHHDTWQKIM
jgi:hypothetical protein